MKKLKLTKGRQEQFLKTLAETGIVYRAAETAGTSRSRVYALRQQDADFAAAWDEAEQVAADRLEQEAWRRGVEGVAEPLVSGGKVIRDDDGHPIAIRRYSDQLLIALLRARRPERFRDQGQTVNVAMSLEKLVMASYAVPQIEAPTIDHDPDKNSR
jgi:hypothetical protein